MMETVFLQRVVWERGPQEILIVHKKWVRSMQKWVSATGF